MILGYLLPRQPRPTRAKPWTKGWRRAEAYSPDIDNLGIYIGIVSHLVQRVVIKNDKNVPTIRRTLISKIKIDFLS